MTILRKRAQHDGLRGIEPRTLEVIAARVADNVRALEGALIRVVAFHSLQGADGPVTPDLAEHVLDRLHPRPSRRIPTVGEIQEQTCQAFELTVEELVSSSRVARLAWPRQLAMYLARELTDASLPAIGRQFGGRNHATVLYAVRRAGERIAVDGAACQAAQHLTEALGGDRAE